MKIRRVLSASWAVVFLFDLWLLFWLDQRDANALALASVFVIMLVSLAMRLYPNLVELDRRRGGVWPNPALQVICQDEEMLNDALIVANLLALICFVFCLVGVNLYA